MRCEELMLTTLGKVVVVRAFWRFSGKLLRTIFRGGRRAPQSDGYHVTQRISRGCYCQDYEQAGEERFGCISV